MAWNAKVSVVVPTYNRARFIGAAVESALAQSYSNLEIIVVDDGSTDNTLDVLGGIADRRLEIVRLPRRKGGGFARNQGISRATGGFVAFLDSDDIWEPEKLERQMQALAEINYPDRVICYSQVKIAGGLVPVISPGRPLGRNEHISDYLWRHGGFMQTSSLLLSKDLLDEVRFDPTQKRHQDWDLLLRLYERKVTFCFVEEPLVSYNADAGMARISRDEDAMASLAWLEKRHALVSASAYDAFRARRAPALARHSPGVAFGAILKAHRRAHINSLQASRYLISSVLGLLAPGVYRRLPDMRVRGAKLAPAAKAASSVGDLPVQRHN